MRRFIISVLAALAVVLAVSGAVVAGTGGGSSVTQARLERSLAPEFARLYADQATLLGHQGVTPASLQARTVFGWTPSTRAALVTVSVASPGRGDRVAVVGLWDL